MDNQVITIYSDEIPDLPNLESIDAEQLLREIIAQLERGKYKFVIRKPGAILPIQGYKTPLQQSEIILHACLRESSTSTKADGINEIVLEHIKNHKLRIVDAVRHVHGPFTRIVANLDS